MDLPLVSACFLAFALTSGPLSAQTSAGALVGLVRDPAGAFTNRRQFCNGVDYLRCNHDYRHAGGCCPTQAG